MAPRCLHPRLGALGQSFGSQGSTQDPWGIFMPIQGGAGVCTMHKGPAVRQLLSRELTVSQAGGSWLSSLHIIPLSPQPSPKAQQAFPATLHRRPCSVPPGPELSCGQPVFVDCLLWAGSCGSQGLGDNARAGPCLRAASGPTVRSSLCPQL